MLPGEVHSPVEGSITCPDEHVGVADGKAGAGLQFGYVPPYAQSEASKTGAAGAVVHGSVFPWMPRAVLAHGQRGIRVTGSVGLIRMRY